MSDGLTLSDTHCEAGLLQGTVSNVDTTAPRRLGGMQHCDSSECLLCHQCLHTSDCVHHGSRTSGRLCSLLRRRSSLGTGGLDGAFQSSCQDPAPPSSTHRDTAQLQQPLTTRPLAPPWAWQPQFEGRDTPAPAQFQELAVLGLPSQSINHDLISALEWSPNGLLLASGSIAKQVCLYVLRDVLASCQPSANSSRSRQHGSTQRRPSSSFTGELCLTPSPQGASTTDTSQHSQGNCGNNEGQQQHSDSDDEARSSSRRGRHKRRRASSATGTTAAAAASCVINKPAAVQRLASKVSCLAWDPAAEGVVSVGDYDGIITQLHIVSGHQLADVDAHAGRRIWGIAYSHQSPGVCASVSEDGTARLWDPRHVSCTPTAVITPPTLPNSSSSKHSLCGLDWSQSRPHLLALASSAHTAYVYDVRAALQPLLVLRHHRRPVSYVRFFGEGQLVTAATDASLAVWDLPQQALHSSQGPSDSAPPPAVLQEPWKVMQGHVNDRHFVGLAVRPEDGLIACGSECCAVFSYHRSWHQPLAQHTVQPWPGVAGAGAPGRQAFVSAVAWQRAGGGRALGLPPLLAAGNSAGSIRLLALTQPHIGV